MIGAIEFIQNKNFATKAVRLKVTLYILNFDSPAKSSSTVMPVPDQVRNDGSGIQNSLNLLDSGFRRNDVKLEDLTFYKFIKFKCAIWFVFDYSRNRNHSK